MADDAGILRARARALARPAAAAGSTAASTLHVLEFRLSDERYAIETRFLREVHPLVDLTRIPCTPSFVLGVVNVRGRIVPVLDLKKLFGLPERGLTDLHWVVIVEQHDVEVGLLADTVVDVCTLPDDALQSLAGPTTMDSGYVRGVTGERLVVLDASRILTDPKLIVDEEVEH